MDTGRGEFEGLGLGLGLVLGSHSPNRTNRRKCVSLLGFGRNTGVKLRVCAFIILLYG